MTQKVKRPATPAAKQSAGDEEALSVPPSFAKVLKDHEETFRRLAKL